MWLRGKEMSTNRQQQSINLDPYDLSNSGGQARILSNLGSQVTTISGAGAYVPIGQGNGSHPAYVSVGASTGIVISGGPAAADQYLEYQITSDRLVLVRSCIQILTSNVADQIAGVRITQSNAGGAFSTLPTSGSGILITAKTTSASMPGEFAVIEQIVTATAPLGATPGSRWRVEVENLAATDDLVIGSVSLSATIM